MSVIVDVFNATNSHRVLAVDQNYVYIGMPGYELWSADANLDIYGNPQYSANLPASPFYKTPTVYQPPRYLQAGLKFTF